MIVNARGRAYTQKVEPSLTLVEPELPHEAFSEGWEPKENSFLGKFDENDISFTFCVS